LAVTATGNQLDVSSKASKDPNEDMAVLNASDLANNGHDGRSNDDFRKLFA
jgi:hypothetical protein